MNPAGRGLDRARAGARRPRARGRERPAAPPAAGAAPSRRDEPEILTLPPELFGGRRRPARPPLAVGAGLPAWRCWPWLAQAAWFFPGEIALRLPNLRPLLVQYCAWTGCRVALPRVPDLLFIEASDLQLLDPAHPNEVLLTATVRNRAAFAAGAAAARADAHR